MSNSFKDIKAWQFAHQFVIDVYKHTREFPETERFGLCSQFQRAAVSIAANIAEGYKKLSKPDKLRFFNISLKVVLKNVAIIYSYRKIWDILTMIHLKILMQR